MWYCPIEVTKVACIKKKSERKYKITVSNGYRRGKKISRAKTITVPSSVPARGIAQYVSYEAEKFERSFRNGYSEYADTTFEEYAAGWLERQVSYAPSTRASYGRMLEVVYPYIGRIKLYSLKPIVLENMLSELRKRIVRGKVIKETTVQNYLTVVSAVLSDAKRNEIIEHNPARHVPLPKEDEPEQQIPSPEEIKMILRELENEKPVYRLYYFLAIHTGMRRGELCALKWSDIEIQEKCIVITVSQSISTVLGRGLLEGKTKNGKTRTVMLDISAKEALEVQHKDSDYIFVDDNGNRVHPDTFTKRLKKIYKRLGLNKDYHLHSLRHYFVTALLHGDIDKETVAELAGHGDTTFLERTYCHPVDEKKLAAAKVIKI